MAGESRVGSRRIVAVVGGTGLQGGGAVEGLLGRDQFGVRVLTRNPSGERAKALAERGVEVVLGDLNRPETLRPYTFRRLGCSEHGAPVIHDAP